MNAEHSFDVTLAKLAVQAACDAYERATVQSPMAHLLAVREGFTNIIACRGTMLEPAKCEIQRVRDYLTDADVGRTPWRFGGFVHRGFAAAAESVWRDVTTAISPVGPWLKEEGVVLTGHSLGGAVATLLAFAFIESGVPVKAVFTFGSPRVGDREFARAYAKAGLDKVTTRFVNELDVVPRVPGVFLPDFWHGYRHVCARTQFGNGAKLLAHPSLAALLVADLRSARTDFRSGDFDHLLEDHKSANYRGRVVGMA